METHKLDVTSSEDVEHVVKMVSRNGNGVDILVNNAGCGLMGSVVDVPEADFRHQMETNVIAPLALSRKVVPLMREKGRGIIGELRIPPLFRRG
jgi:NAD(P)-dependent dehydrogenase (short-subunit alcohol dehydrogenase family)